MIVSILGDMDIRKFMIYKPNNFSNFSNFFNFFNFFNILTDFKVNVNNIFFKFDVLLIYINFLARWSYSSLCIDPGLIEVIAQTCFFRGGSSYRKALALLRQPFRCFYRLFRWRRSLVFNVCLHRLQACATN